MNIININHKENRKKAVNMLDEYTRQKSPKSFETLREKISLGVEIEGNIESRIVGSISFNALHIELFISNAEARGKGYGSQLLDKVEKMAVEKGCHYIVLETMSFNAPKFYKNKGFEVIKEVKNSPITGESHFYMYKSLI